MRPIDADALKMEFPKDEDWDYPVNTNSYVCELIDAQLTIEPERKKGEWIDDYDPVNFGEFRYKCSECGARTVEWADNFCYHCGADMRGEGHGKNK